MDELAPTIPAAVPEKHLPYKKILLFSALFFVAILPVIFFVSSLKNTDADITRIADLSIAKEKIDDALKRGVTIPLPTNALDVSF